METATLGKVLVTAKIENLGDLYNVNRGLLSEDKVRRIEVSDAVVDTGAMMLSLPKRLIDQLGLTRQRTRPVRTPSGSGKQAFTRWFVSPFKGGIVPWRWSRCMRNVRC
ncbi:MAG TPA: hypothetical protein VEL76_21085 [Gemmataceae bacterium]|nr:hypothetical protein [Gemmataceae bacterium]